MVNFQASFVANLSTLAHPLNALLSTKNPFNWSPECEKASQAVKQAVTFAPSLDHFNPDRPTILAVDATPYGVGAVVSNVLLDGSNRPISFASQTLNSHQQDSSQLDKEALAIIFGHHFFVSICMVVSSRFSQTTSCCSISWARDATIDEPQRFFALHLHFGSVCVRNLRQYWSKQSLYNGLWARQFIT